MAAPNPFCPNTKGICCLMLLINLGLILVTLGFVVVIQFFEPLFVWYVSTFTALHTFINQLHGSHSSLSSQKFFSWFRNFPYFFNIQININFSSMARSSRWSLSFTFFQEDHLFCPICVTCYTHHILLNFIIIIIIIIKVLHAVKLSSLLLFPLTGPNTSPQHPQSVPWSHTVIMKVVYLYQHHTI